MKTKTTRTEKIPMCLGSKSTARRYTLAGARCHSISRNAKARCAKRSSLETTGYETTSEHRNRERDLVCSSAIIPRGDPFAESCFQKNTSNYVSGRTTTAARLSVSCPRPLLDPATITKIYDGPRIRKFCTPNESHKVSQNESSGKK